MKQLQWVQYLDKFLSCKITQPFLYLLNLDILKSKLKLIFIAYYTIKSSINIVWLIWNYKYVKTLCL